MDELQTIQAIKDGATDRYADLVERYQIGLIIYCERLLGDRSEAEDIAQAAFIKAYNNLHGFKPDKARFSTWLYKIARNESIDFLRKHRRVQASEEVETLEPSTLNLLDEELKREVREAVLALVPPEQRKVVEAYYWEGKSYQQIANEMHVPLNTVKSWLHRAKIQLKEALA